MGFSWSNTVILHSINGFYGIVTTGRSHQNPVKRPLDMCCPPRARVTPGYTAEFYDILHGRSAPPHKRRRVSPTRRWTNLSLRTFRHGPGPRGGIRTRDLLVMSQTSYRCSTLEHTGPPYSDSPFEKRRRKNERCRTTIIIESVEYHWRAFLFFQ